LAASNARAPAAAPTARACWLRFIVQCLIGTVICSATLRTDLGRSMRCTTGLRSCSTLLAPLSSQAPPSELSHRGSRLPGAGIVAAVNHASLRARTRGIRDCAVTSTLHAGSLDERFWAGDCTNGNSTASVARDSRSACSFSPSSLRLLQRRARACDFRALQNQSSFLQFAALRFVPRR
jgi:hypothetical protein